MKQQDTYPEDSVFLGLDRQKQLELLDLENTPVKPARPCTPGEGIYLKYWQEYIEQDPGRLINILRDTVDNVNQRMVSVCASFMVWMGNNDGRGFAAEAEALARRHNEDKTTGNYISTERSYLMAWAAHNQRSYGVDGGVRTIEVMLCPIDHYTVSFGRHIYAWEEFEKITMQDIDTVECMVRWWSTEDADYIRRCAIPEISKAHRLKLAALAVA